MKKSLIKGFTLLEVMVALSICAMAGIAAMQVSGEHINHLSILEQQTYASWVAENRLVELSLATKWPPKNNHKGDEEQAGHKWYWQQKVEKTQTSDFVKVIVTIYEDDKYQQDIYELSTYLTKSNGKSSSSNNSSNNSRNNNSSDNRSNSPARGSGR